MKTAYRSVFLIGGVVAAASVLYFVRQLQGKVAVAEVASGEQSPTPAPQVQDGSSIYATICAAAQAGQPRVVIPPGVYRIPAPEVIAGKDQAHWEFTEIQNLEIDATGAVFIFTGRHAGSMVFRKCKNITLRGATLRRETPAFSQGKIVAIDPQGKFVDIRIDKGYPTDIDDPALFDHFWSNVFRPEGQQRGWITQLRAPTPYVMKRLDTDLMRVDSHEINATNPRIQAGDRLAWRGRTFYDIMLWKCSDITMNRVTVAGGCGMGFIELGGDGGHVYEDCVITYGARPPGAVDDPLYSTNADGFHSSDVRKGARLERCRFEGMDDDGMAVHGNFAIVCEADGTRVVVRRWWPASNKLGAEPGDTLRFYDKDGVYSQEARVASVKSLADYRPPTPLDSTYREFQDNVKVAYLEFTMEAPVSVQPGWLAANQDTMGKGFVFRNCEIRDSYARGIVPKSADGLIEGCVIERIARAGIEVLPEMTWWSESDYCRNLIIRNNTIRNVNTNRREGFNRYAGALTVFSFRNSSYVKSPGGHRDIHIENNVFENNQGTNIVVTSASEVQIKNNRFLSPMTQPREFGTEKGVNPHALIWVSKAQNVQLEGNEVVAPGPYLKTLVDTVEVTGTPLSENGVKQVAAP
ncbi:MAG: right-handed parallel beta-helix repeat-containing protein [Chthoniobacteraceae bacterium]